MKIVFSMTLLSRFTMSLWSVGLLIAFLLIFGIHLQRGALFWDEWMYVSEIQAAPSYASWIFYPSTAHVFILPKAVTSLIYHYFGVWFLPYKCVSFSIHIATAVALYSLLRLQNPRSVSAVITTVFTLSTAYEEVLAWSAHYREQFFVLFFYVWNYAALSSITQEKFGGLRAKIIALCALFIMTLSFANILLGCVIGLFFCLFFFRDLKRSGALPGYSATLLASSLLYWMYYRAPLAIQSAEQSDSLSDVSLSRILLTCRNSFEFTRFGVLERIFSPTTRTVPALIITALGIALFILPLVRSFKMGSYTRARSACWFLTCSLLIVFSQAWYRTDLQFMLTWNKYSFLPIAFLLPAIAQGMSSSSSLWRSALSIILITTCVARVFSPLRPSYASLTGSASVQALVEDFGETFSEISWDQPSLLTFQLPWSIFIPSYSPSPRLLWKADPRLRTHSASFFDISQGISPLQSAAISETFRKAPRIQSFYDKYLPHIDAPAAGDGGIVSPSHSNQIFLQEVKNPTSAAAYLRGVILVLGTSSKSNKSKITLSLHDQEFRKIHEQIIPASHVLNNQPSEFPVPETELLKDAFFVALKMEVSDASPTVAIYKTKMPLAHLGRSWICAETDATSSLSLNKCALQDPTLFGMFGVGLKLFPASLFGP